MADIDWTNINSQVTEHFTVHELTYLPSWLIHHIPSDEEKLNLIALATKMELVRAFIEKPINVHVTIRPTSVNCPGPYNGRNYNSLVGGAPKSGHVLGKSMDFNFYEMQCDEGRMLLLPKLEEFDLRMEKRDGSNWIHLGNDWQFGMNRYFIP